VIPLNEPLGPAVITLVLDDCALPTKDSIIKVPKMFWLSSKTSRKGRTDPNRHRNICIALGCIAEKLAGPTSVALLTENTLDYLLANLVIFSYTVFLCIIYILKYICRTPLFIPQ
jgi:hypothetical protein